MVLSPQELRAGASLARAFSAGSSFPASSWASQLLTHPVVPRVPGVLEGVGEWWNALRQDPSILDKSVGLYLPLIFEASKQTTTGSRRREGLAL